jgi:hypothetical protein
MVSGDTRVGSTARQTPRVVAALRARLEGPGGCYNIGNAIGLLVGLLVQVRSTAGPADLTLALATRSVGDYFAGNAAAVALTLATIVFFWSGEEYHRAWAGGFPPLQRRNRNGDILSGVGALFLGAGLLALGEPLLAATSGLLHAAGKFGSAVDVGALGGGDRIARRLRDLFRWSVVASRAPAIVAALLALGILVSTPGPIDADAAIISATLVVCYALWTRADLMLLRPLRA